MNIQDLKVDLVHGKFKNLYIFHGEEHAVMNLYISKISEKFDKSYNCDSFETILKKLNGKSLFQKSAELYVVRYDNTLISSDKIWDTFIDKLSKNNMFVILKFDSLDTRTKFYKKFTDNIVQFDKMSKDVLKKHIKQKMDLSDDSCNYLIDICNSDYSRILLELDKISNAKQFYDLDDKNCFKMCLSSKLFYEPPEDVVFSLIDAILTRNTKLAYELLEESKRRNDSTIMILSILHNNAKQLLQVQEMCACKDKSEFTGLTPFQLKSASKYINRYNTKELIRFIRMIRYCDKSIKDGTMTDDIVIDYIFINIFRKD